jgi:acyl dehydratase
VAIDERVVAAVRDHIGEEDVQELGVVSELLIRRYARAIGDDNPLYHDAGHARRAGLANVVAPPNLLPSIVDWGDGAPEDRLRKDGTEPEVLTGVPQSGVRVMGGGEEMEFHAPVVAGSRVLLRSRLEDVEERETRSGPMAIVKYGNVFESPEGEPYLTCMRSVLLR